jgi:hypothetical protein
VLLLALAACGGDGAESTSGEATDTPSSSAASSAAPSEEPAETEPSESSDEAEDAEGGGSWDRGSIVRAMAAAMEGQQSAHISMVTTAGGMELVSEGDLAFREKSQDMSLVMEGEALGSDRVEVRLVDGSIYMSMPPMTPKGKFFRIPDDPNSPFGPMLGQMQGMDPRESFEAFESGLRKVTFVGEETVDGEELERYRLSVDPRVAAKAQGLPRDAQMPKRVDYDLWLDDDALMRRMEMELAQVEVVSTLSEWNEPVTIKAPGPKQLVPLPGN